MKESLQTAIVQAHERASNLLLAQFDHKTSYCAGKLSSSALSTAVAAYALSRADAEKYQEPIARALGWLAAHQNQDGGWGDSPDSISNLSTTLLSWSALTLDEESHGETIRRAENYIENTIGGALDPERVTRAVIAHYGNDRTFSAPILACCALAGRLGPDGWRHAPQLPFEIAILPHQLFKWLRLPIVSYAIPALIAIGLVRHRNAPRRRFSPLGWLRDRLTPGVLRVLDGIQPRNGGFLEATPLTAFVAMSLASSDQRDHPVLERAVRFLLDSERPDGSWPIDSNLSIWVTTLSVGALAESDDVGRLPAPEKTRDWLLAQQYQEEHPFTHAAPGGWAWTNLEGGVPDADDTSGALLALDRLGDDPDIRRAVHDGIRWLLDLQNRDGGVPTFCQGWGKLPFDKSCPDITAHALLAWTRWRDKMNDRFRPRLDSAMRRAVRYLERAQRNDGAWIPLWFGNQAAPRMENRTYGTAQVVAALSELTHLSGVEPLLTTGRAWLIQAQSPEGGWSGDAGDGPCSIEETALALRALAGGPHDEAIERGARWLLEHTRQGSEFPAVPIGLYFATLWYSEQHYPLVFTVSALGRLVRANHVPQRNDSPK